MTETKTALFGGKHTLLHYLYEVVDKHYKDLHKVVDELAHVTQGSKVSLPALKTEMSQMRKGLNSLKAELDIRKDDVPPADDEFMVVMKVRFFFYCFIFFFFFGGALTMSSRTLTPRQAAGQRKSRPTTPMSRPSSSRLCSSMARIPRR